MELSEKGCKSVKPSKITITDLLNFHTIVDRTGLESNFGASSTLPSRDALPRREIAF